MRVGPVQRGHLADKGLWALWRGKCQPANDFGGPLPDYIGRLNDKTKVLRSGIVLHAYNFNTQEAWQPGAGDSCL
jgi:hypothetical protein